MPPNTFNIRCNESVNLSKISNYELTIVFKYLYSNQE
jgi:hypothetical protein